MSLEIAGEVDEAVTPIEIASWWKGEVHSLLEQSGIDLIAKLQQVNVRDEDLEHTVQNIVKESIGDFILQDPVQDFLHEKRVKDVLDSEPVRDFLNQGPVKDLFQIGGLTSLLPNTGNKAPDNLSLINDLPDFVKFGTDFSAQEESSYALKSVVMTSDGHGKVVPSWRQVRSIMLTVDQEPFAEGHFRQVYKATERNTGTLYVVKKYKNKAKESIINKWKMTIESHARKDVQKNVLASYFTKRFSKESDLEYDLRYHTVYLSQDDEGPVFVEEFIDEKKSHEFVKYVNNTGQIFKNPSQEEQDVCEAFVHYTLEQTGGALMVSDIQGWFPLLCDPEVSTLEKTDGNKHILFTAGNFFLAGISKFKQDHECSIVCEKLGLKKVQ